MVEKVGEKADEKVVVSAKDVGKLYRLGDTEVSALSNVSLKVKAGEFLALAGSSGSGKTTLLNLFGCLDNPTHGSVEFEGRDVGHLSDHDLAALRAQRIGFVFQNFNLIPVLNALENVEFALIKSPHSSSIRNEKSRSILARVGLEKFIHHRPNQLSGGQRQRVAIARALVHSPSLVIADEPTANLDKTTAMDILKLMADVNAKDGVTFIFSTHDPNILSIAKRIVSLSDGKIVNEQKNEQKKGTP